MIDKIAKFIGGVLICAAFIVLAAMIMSFPLWLFWNWAVPDIFDTSKITIFQSWCLLVLSGILFNRSSSD